MTDLTADQQKDVLENAPDDLKDGLILGGQESYKNYKETVKYTAPVTTSQAYLSDNPYFNSMAVKNQKSIYAMDRAFENIKSDSAILNFIGYWQKANLSEEYNHTYLEAIEAEGWKKEYLNDKLMQLGLDLNGLPQAEDLGDKFNDTLSSIARSVWKNTPYVLGGVAVSAAAPVGVVGAGIIGAVARGTGAFMQTYKPTQESIAVQLLEQNPNMTKDEAMKQAKSPAILSAISETAGEILSLSGKASTAIANTPLNMFKKTFKEEAAKRVANKTLRQRLFNYMFKEAPKSAGGESLTELLQNNFEREGLKGKGTLDIVKSTANNMLDLVGKLISNQELTNEDKDDLETIFLTFGGDLLFGGATEGISSTLNIVADANRERGFKRKVNKFNEAVKGSDMPEQMVSEIAQHEVQEGVAPKRVFAKAEDVINAVDAELNENTSLSEEKRTRLEEIKQQAEDSKTSTGIYEMDGALYLSTMANDKFSTTLFQRVADSFYEKASMVKGDFTDSQIVMQLVKEMLPNALEQGSAFLDFQQALSKSGLSEQDLAANALTGQILMNFAEMAKGKSWQDIKKENNIKFEIPKNIFGKEKSKVVDATLKDLKTGIEEGRVVQETGSDIIIDENNNVIDGNKQVEALKQKGEKTAQVKQVSNKDAENIKQQRSDNIAGYLSNEANKIVLGMTQEANPTTFSHEVFHLFEVLMTDAFLKGELKDDVLKSYKKMFKGAGIDIEQYKDALKGTTALNMFLGTKAKELDALNFYNAYDRLKKGEDKKEIYKETGWFKGEDGRWRYEISDYDSNIITTDTPRITTLGKFFKHDKLYEAYPELKNLKFVWNGKLQRAKARYCPKNSVPGMPAEHIEVKPIFKKQPLLLISEILHEVQHYIQQHEGFSKTHPTTEISYWKSAHENEARKVQGRMDMSEEQLRNSYPEDYVGYSNPYLPKEQIFGNVKPETLPQRPTTEKTEKGFTIVVEETQPTDTLTSAREQLAEAWTQYLGEGKEPISSFKDMFAWMKNMFSGIYQNFVRANALTPEIREVYDEIFAKQQEAVISSKVMRLGGVKKPANVSDEDYAKYLFALDRALAGASNRVISSINKIKNEVKQTQKYLDAKKQYTQEIRDELSKDTIYKVKAFNKKTKLPIEAACVQYNNENGTNLTTSEYEGMLKQPSLESVVNKRVSERMVNWLSAEYPELVRDMKTYNTIINNDMIEVLCWESSFETGKTFEKTVEELKTKVKDFVSRNKVKSIMETSKYQDMMKNNLMMQEEKGADLGKLKLNQAVISSIISKSKEYTKKYDSIFSILSKYKTDPDKQDVKNLDAFTRDLLKAIGFYFGVHNKPPRENIDLPVLLSNWISEHDNLRLNRNLSDELNFGLKLINNPDKMSELTTGDFNDLVHLVNSIEGIGKDDTLGNKREDEASLMADVQTTVSHLKDIKFKNKIKDKTFMSLLTYGGMMMPRLLSKILPEQINFKYIAPLVNGFSKATNWKNERANEFKEILSNEINRFKENEIVELNDGTTIALTREEKLMLLLNSVNDHNSACMTLLIQNNPIKFGQMLEQEENESKTAFEERKNAKAIETYRTILESCDTSLQETANKILEKIDSHKDEFKQAYLEAEGLKLKLVEPNHFNFNGSILNKNLGYFPSPRKASLSIDENFDTDFVNRSGFPTAQFAKDRTAIHDDCELSIDVINRWIRCTGDYINMAASWKNLTSLLNKDVALKQALGETAFNKIKEWMLNLRQPEKTNYFLRQLDNLSNICILGLDPLKAFRQLSGLTFSSSDIGIGHVANAMFEVFSSGNLNFMKQAMSLSEYMKTRYSDPSVYLFGGYSNYEVDKNIAKDVLGKMGTYFLIPLTYMDAFASTVTWKAQYNKAMLEGKTEQQASYEADRAVMLTQGESSALARPEFLRGNLRFMSKYSTYFFALNSALSSNLMTTGDPKAIINLASVIFVAMLGGSLYETTMNMIAENITGNDDNDDPFWKRSFQEFVSTSSAAVFPAFGLGASFGRAISGGKVYRSSMTSVVAADNFIRAGSYMVDENKDFGDVINQLLTTGIPKSILNVLK